MHKHIPRMNLRQLNKQNHTSKKWISPTDLSEGLSLPKRMIGAKDSNQRVLLNRPGSKRIRTPFHGPTKSIWIRYSNRKIDEIGVGTLEHIHEYLPRQADAKELLKTYFVIPDYPPKKNRDIYEKIVRSGKVFISPKAINVDAIVVIDEALKEKVRSELIPFLISYGLSL